MNYGKDCELNGTFSTEYNAYLVVQSGVQLSGSIRSAEFEKLPKYSVQFTLSISALSDDIMSPRIGD